MKDMCYLVFNRRGVLRLAKKRPGLAEDEFCALVKITVDDKFFQSPDTAVTVRISEEHIPRPRVEAIPELAC